MRFGGRAAAHNLDEDGADEGGQCINHKVQRRRQGICHIVMVRLVDHKLSDNHLQSSRRILLTSLYTLMRRKDSTAKQQLQRCAKCGLYFTSVTIMPSATP